MKNKLRQLYRKMFSHTPYMHIKIDLLAYESHRNKDYNFNFISSASLSLISATFFIGMLSVNFKAISTIASIEITLSMLFFALSLSVNSFTLFYLYMAMNDENNKITILIILKYKLFAFIKIFSFLFPALGVLFLISYFNEYIAIASLILFFILSYFYGLVMERAERKTDKILK